MRKLWILGVLFLLLAGCSAATSERPVLNIFNWGEYLDEDVIHEFEAEYNVHVNQELFESNEAMYLKLQDGSSTYDVLVPSDYMVQRMREEDLLMELDWQQIPNVKNIIPELRGLDMDPENEFAVPYLWGNVGLIYNKDAVALEDLQNEGWNILQNTDYNDRIFFYDSERDAFMVALKANGFSMNTTNEAEIAIAYDWLVKMKQTMSPIYVTDEVLDGMISGEKDIAVVYSGDANYILEQNEAMAYYVPEEGTNRWVDAMVIPKHAKEVELAHAWINFISRPDISLQNVEAIGYTSPIQAVIDEVTSPGGPYYGIASYVPRTDNPNDEAFDYDPLMKTLLANYWQRVKAIN